MGWEGSEATGSVELQSPGGSQDNTGVGQVVNDREGRGADTSKIMKNCPWQVQDKSGDPAQTAWIHEKQVLIDQLDLLLWQENPSGG